MNFRDEMLELIPYDLRISPQYIAIFDTLGKLVERNSIDVDGLLNQTFIETATWSLDLFEKEFGIEKDVSKSTKERRSVIISKKRGTGTVTVSLVKSVTESFHSEQVEVNENFKDSVIEIIFSSDSGMPPRQVDVYAAVTEIFPAHLKVKYYVKTGDEINGYDPERKVLTPIIKHRPNIGKGLTVKPTLKLSAGESLGTGVFHRSSEVRSGPFVVGPSNSRRRNVNVTVGNDINTGKHKAQPIKTHTQQTSRATSNKFALSTQTSSGSSQLGYCGMDYSKGGG